MADETPEYQRLMEEIEITERSWRQAREAESEARRTATQCENRLNQANKALVDYMIANKPALVNAIRKATR